ncbi:MAG: hypothetical protein GX496_02090, partial [Firmicutes bacterium]|nr:hypothetical protein [Bacillota bacterium]
MRFTRLGIVWRGALLGVVWFGLATLAGAGDAGQLPDAGVLPDRAEPDYVEALAAWERE